MFWRPPILPCRLQQSTVGRTGLNRRVRYGNGCVPCAYRHQNFLSESLNSEQQCSPYFVYFFLRKEVIQPHLPIRLPCYDFTPVTRPAFDGCFPLIHMSPTPFRDIFFFSVAKLRFATNAAHIHEGLAHRLRAFLTPMV